jgi:hypothetical protein
MATDADRPTPPVGRARSVTFTVAVVSVVAAAAMGAAVPPRHPDGQVSDPALYLDVVHRMRDGGGYYGAMAQRMVDLGIGPVETVRAFRLPTMFVMADLLGSDALVRAALAVTVVCMAALLASGLRRPLVAIAPAVYLVGVASTSWPSPDLWAASLALGAVGAARRERWWSAVLLAAGATAFRELAVFALAGVALQAWRSRASLRPWFLALPALAGLAVVHVGSVTPYLVAAGEGAETPLLGTGSLWAAAVLGGWLLPGAAVVGPAVLTIAVLHARRERLGALVGPVLAFPVVGLIIERPVWSLFVFPLALALATDEVATWVSAARARARPLRRQPEPPQTSPLRPAVVPADGAAAG